MIKVLNNKSSFKNLDLSKLAKRENNIKRSYLIVNPLQAKHMPINPEKTLKLFKELGEQISSICKDEKVLFIGFAETATAVGAGVASCFPNSYYIHTTREKIENVEIVVEFCEEHSHAVEQILYCENWDNLILNIDRIIFVEDEITTGKTIVNFINALKDNGKVDKKMKFSACSIINAMSKDRRDELMKIGLNFHYLMKIEVNCSENDCFISENNEPYVYDYKFTELSVNGLINPRLGISTASYIDACNELSKKVAYLFDYYKKRIAVIGTEEFMYPVIKIANFIRKDCHPKFVNTHSTTRSPIVCDKNENYPIKSRFKLTSLYDEKRTTYIYNTDKHEYDIVMIITDSNKKDINVNQIAGAFNQCKNFLLVRWN